MFALLLTASLALAPASPTYTSDALYGFVALANDRIVDGYSYTDRRGIVSSGLLYSAPRGFIATSQLSAFKGEGQRLPAEALVLLESAAGWRFELNDNRYSITLLDYRFTHSDSNIPAHQGIGLGYQHGAFTIEYAFEAEKPYVQQPYESHRVDAHRVLFAWSQSFGNDMRWSAGIGSVENGANGRRNFASGSALWRWQEFDWQLTLVHANEQGVRYGENIAETQLQLRISKPFRLR